MLNVYNSNSFEYFPPNHCQCFSLFQLFEKAIENVDVQVENIYRYLEVAADHCPELVPYVSFNGDFYVVLYLKPFHL